MKKLSLLFVCILTIASCEKDALTEEVSLEETVQNPDVYARQGNNVSKQGNNVAVCHNNGNIIFVNENALSAHIAHGDAVDEDGDGFFNMENSCSEGIDCEDTNADVNPGAEEIYTDDIDNNCNDIVGYTITTIEDVNCSGCTGGTSGQYQNSRGRCSDTRKPGYVRCTTEVVHYEDESVVQVK